MESVGVLTLTVVVFVLACMGTSKAGITCYDCDTNDIHHHNCSKTTSTSTPTEKNCTNCGTISEAESGIVKRRACLKGAISEQQLNKCDVRHGDKTCLCNTGDKCNHGVESSAAMLTITCTGPCVLLTLLVKHLLQ